MPPKPDLLTLI